MFLSAIRASVSFCIIPILVFAQSGPNNKVPNTATASLSKPVDMGIAEYRMFEDEPRKVKVRLVTSWIPGEKHAGMFRYRLSVWVERPIAELTKPDESIERLLQRTVRCSITLELYDKDEFILRRHVVPVVRGVDPEQARLNSLSANDAFQLDAEEYRQLINSGAWAISWGCPGL
jgi:hypothetical protein